MRMWVFGLATFPCSAPLGQWPPRTRLRPVQVTPGCRWCCEDPGFLTAPCPTGRGGCSPHPHLSNLVCEEHTVMSNKVTPFL